MAVLNATDWFTGTSSDEEREKDLVLNQLGVQPYFAEVLDRMAAVPGSVRAVGFMLLFGPGLPKNYQEIVWDSAMTPESM